MRLDLYATTKRINSFERPGIDTTHTVHTVMDPVYFKDSDISMTKPSFYIAAANYAEVNYCVLSNFDSVQGGGHVYRPSKIYYWITDIRHDHEGRWWIDCEIDLLATWKEDILSQTAFIERSASHFNKYLIDSEIPTEPQLTERQAVSAQGSAADWFDSSAYSGTYLLTVLSSRGPGTVMSGITSTYAMTATQVVGLKYGLINPGTLATLKQQFADATSCLISLRYSPFPISDIAGSYYGDTPAVVYIGTVPMEVGADSYAQGYGIGTSRIDKFALLDIPKIYDDYRGVSITTYTLYLPFVGYVDIAPEQLLGATQLSISFIYDVFTGDYGYLVKAFRNGTLVPITSMVGNCDEHLPLGNYRNNIQEAMTHALSMGALGLTTIAGAAVGSLPMAIGAGAGMVGQAAQTIQALHQKTGTVVGGYKTNMQKYLGTKPILYVEAAKSSIDPALVASTLGRPCGSIHQLSALSGYTRTRNFRLKNSGYMTLTEQKYVEDLMNNVGVFI